MKELLYECYWNVSLCYSKGILLIVYLQGQLTERSVVFLAIYHCSVKIIGRGKGKSVIAAVAYRAGEKLYDGETGVTHDFTRKGGVMHREILLPGHAPEEYTDRQTLWESVTKAEKKSNAQLAREVEVAVPIEFSEELQLAVIREYVQGNFVSEGMCADIAIHDKGNGNPHAHILLTTRPIKADVSWAQRRKRIMQGMKTGNASRLLIKRPGCRSWVNETRNSGNG